MMIEQAKQQADVQKFQAQTTIDMQKAKEASAQESQRMVFEAEQKEKELSAEYAYKQWEFTEKMAYEKWKLDRECDMQREMKTMDRETAGQTLDANAHQKASDRVGQELAPIMDRLQELSEQNQALHAHVTAPRTIKRGPDGRATGVEVGGRMIPINRGPDGRIEGI